MKGVNYDTMHYLTRMYDKEDNNFQSTKDFSSISGMGPGKEQSHCLRGRLVFSCYCTIITIFCFSLVVKFLEMLCVDLRLLSIITMGAYW